jgi:Chaperone of endosialidase
MGQLVFQATLGGQVNLVGPNTASTFNINVPAVAGNMVTTGDTGTVTNTMLASSAYTAPGTIGSGTPNTGAFTTLSASGNVTLGDASTDTLNVGNGGIVKDSSNKVGIGTASPSTNLTIANGGGGNDLGVFLSRGATTNFYEAYDGTKSFIAGVDASVGYIKMGSLSNHPVTITQGNGIAVYVDTSKNVGIGTSSPAVKLDVNGDIQQRNGGGVTIGKIWNDSGLYSISADSANVTGLKLNASGTQYISSWTNGSERARIDSSGNLLVGTTSLPSGAADGICLRAGNGGTKYSVGSTGNVYQIQFYNPNGIVGGILTNGSLTTYSISSDYRLKENVTPLTGALNKIAQLKPSVYNYKADPETQIEGFIAHELQSVVPHAVTGEKDAVDAKGKPVYQGVDASFLIPHLVAAIQELNAKITALENK